MESVSVVRKGGKTALSQSIRRLEEYEYWKRSVFLRDRFTCQHCGARNGRKRVIEADHIKSLSALIVEHKIESVEMALGCPALWDTNNGRTLCHTCHQKTDSYPQNFVDKPKKKNEKNKPRRRSKTANSRSLQQRRLIARHS